MSSSNNNNNNNNNNNGRSHNCYIVLVPAKSPAYPVPGHASHCQKLAQLAAAAEAACRDQDRIMAVHICRVASQPSFLHAASGSNSLRANNRSHSSRPMVHNTSHICHGVVAPLLSSDQMKRSTSGPGWNRGVKADPKEVTDFRSALKAGGFPPLVPEHFLKSAQDLRNNASPSSYVSKAAKGVKPGTKILPRHLMSTLPSWRETWMKAEDWLPVLKGQEDVLWWGIGAGFCCQYRHPLKVIVDVDEMASSHGTFGSMRMEQVNMCLASLESASIPLLDTIEFVNAYGCVDKMI